MDYVISVENVFLTDLKVHFGKGGKLIAIESDKTIPFPIKRIYYIYNVEDGQRRGFHSHKKLNQILICVSGSVKICVKSPKYNKDILLDNPNKGLYIGNMVWREMYDFTEDAVLLVLASEYYNPDDYIHSYDIYEKYALDYFSSI